MNKLKESLKYLKIKDFIAIIIFVLMLVPSFVFRLINLIRKKKLLLITEDGISARDNGYHLFKYIRQNHSDDYCYYVIDKKSKDYAKVKEFGNIIQYGSLKHWLFYLSAKYNISNHKNGNPNAPVFYVIHVILGLYNNRVFLQHGITKDDADWLYYSKCKFRYFICGAKREYEFIKEKFGYPEGNVIYTGFARFDNLYNNNVNDKQILVMPTWRNWLGRETNALGEKIVFKDTEYFKNWESFLNDEKFINFIEKEKITILFYPHINMQKYIDEFMFKSKNIIICKTDIDIQKILKESSLMITDYSSVYMDFAYMKKPVIYYQFDYEEYRKKQYQDGYYSYSKDGFGPVVDNKDDLLNELVNIYKNGIKKIYINRMSDFFELKDNKNCERIYSYLK